MDNFRIVAIDPGTSTLGYCCLDLSFDDYCKYVKRVLTLNASDRFKFRKDSFYNIEPRKARIKYLKEELIKLFKEDEPHVVIIEAPFYKVNISTYATLVECKIAIRDAIDESGIKTLINFIDPITVKYGIGAIEKVVKKDKYARRVKIKKVDSKILVRRKLETFIDLLFDNGIEHLDFLDEHSVDAISIGYWRADQAIAFLKYDNENIANFRKSLENLKCLQTLS